MYVLLISSIICVVEIFLLLAQLIHYQNPPYTLSMSTVVYSVINFSFCYIAHNIRLSLIC